MCYKFQCIALNLVEKAARICHCAIALKQTSKIKRKLGLCNWNYSYGNYHKVVITSWNSLLNILFLTKTRCFRRVTSSFSLQAIWSLQRNYWTFYTFENNVMYKFTCENTDPLFFASAHMHVNENRIWPGRYRHSLHCYPAFLRTSAVYPETLFCDWKQTLCFWALNIVIQSLFSTENNCVFFSLWDSIKWQNSKCFSLTKEVACITTSAKEPAIALQS